MPHFYLTTAATSDVSEDGFPVSLQIGDLDADAVEAASKLYRKHFNGSFIEKAAGDEAGFICTWFRTAADAATFIGQLAEEGIHPDNRSSVSQTLRRAKEREAAPYR